MLIFSVFALSTQAQTSVEKPIQENATTEVSKDSKVEKAGCDHSHKADHKCTGKCAGKAKDGKCCSGKTAATGCCSSKKSDAKAEGTKSVKSTDCKGSSSAAKKGCCSSKK